MKALSIKQPWAWLICAGYKDIENRNWKIGRNLRHGAYSSYDVANFTISLPERIYVHAGKIGDFNDDTVAFLEGIGGLKGDEMIKLSKAMTPSQFGAIIGEVDIIDCVEQSESPWFVGRYGFVLTNPSLYGKPIPCLGRLGFLEPELGAVNP